MKQRKFIPLFVYLLVLALVFSLVTGAFSGLNKGPAYSVVVSLFEQEQVRSFTVSGGKIYLELYNPYKGDTEITAEMADSESLRREMRDLIQKQSADTFLRATILRRRSAFLSMI